MRLQRNTNLARRGEVPATVKILISGICGFVGSTLARSLLHQQSSLEIVGLDNFSRPGSSLNVELLRSLGVKVLHADLRASSDLETIEPMDWIIDAAANASVVAGVTGATTSRQLVEHNLYGTVNLLEVAKKCGGGFILLSTSRVYSIPPLSSLPVIEKDGRFWLAENGSLPDGISAHGITEQFSTSPPVSLYGATKAGAELLALEYGSAFGFPVWINRCGVLAGAGQFGRADQGIFSFWINAYLRGLSLRYIGFDGKGLQTRDCFHPSDLAPLLMKQMNSSAAQPAVLNLGGGTANAMSLAQLSDWCATRFGKRPISADLTSRPFDLPWVVMDFRLAKAVWDWQPRIALDDILVEIALHAEDNPNWLQTSGALDTERI